MKFNTIIILFLITSFILIGFAIWKISSVDKKKVNPDVPTNCYGEDCKYDCGILDPKTIRKCDTTPEGQKVCSKCKCDSSGKLSGCMECRYTNPNDPKTLMRINNKNVSNQCIDPFFWDENDSSCKLKEGTYCLPSLGITQDIDCNQYTGSKLLTLDEKTNTYKWSCVCKNNLKFSGPTCSNINVCGMEGSPNNPNNLVNRGLLKSGTTDNYWNKDSEWDPLDPKNSHCSCSFNEVADNTNLLCLPDDCYPGVPNEGDKSGQSCICTNKGLVDCYSISLSYNNGLAYYNGACKFPSCVPDPCGGPMDSRNSGTKGKYVLVKDGDDIIGGKCQCNPGYHLVPDPSSYSGFSCRELCIDNGPCGNRGQCKIQELDRAFTNFTIRCRDVDENNQCISSLFHIIYNNPNNPNDSYYLNYYRDTRKLILEKTQNPDSYFSFYLKKCKVGNNNQPDCTDTVKEPVKTGLNSSSYYYILIGDKYLSLKQNSEGLYNLLDENDVNKEDSLFLFINDQGNKRPLASVAGIMFFPSFQKYLSINPNDKSITYEVSTKTQEYCDPCYDGWRQDTKDPNMKCQESCENSGYQYSYKEFIGTSDGPGRSGPQDYDDSSYKICCYGGTYSLNKRSVYDYKNDVTNYWYHYTLTCSDKK
jgi:hypothetical protein